MTLYHSLVLMLNLKTNIYSDIKITLLIVLADSIVTGLLIKFCGHLQGLAIAIGGLFILVHVKAISALSLTALSCVSITIVVASHISFPSCNLTTLTEFILLGLMTLFLLFLSFKGLPRSVP